MMIDENLRIEKRAKILEDIRKPILLTPGSKRSRNVQEEWEQPQPYGGASPSPGQAIPAGRGMKMSQTPMQKPRTTATGATEMSSSAASPKLKRATKKTHKIKRVPEVTRGLRMSEGKVTLISKLFEASSKAANMVHKQPEQHNHNTVCILPALGPNTGISAVCSAPTYPEMSSQSGKTSQPIGRQIPGQVTPELVQQPI